MADLVRGLDLVLADLDTRQRQGNPSKNRPLQKYQSISDSVTLTDTQTVATYTPPFQFASESYRRAVYGLTYIASPAAVVGMSQFASESYLRAVYGG